MPPLSPRAQVQAEEEHGGLIAAAEAALGPKEGAAGEPEGGLADIRARSTSGRGSAL